MTVIASSDRLGRAQSAAAAADVDALLISPGPDLRYLTGYDAIPLERLTCLIVPAAADPVLVAPALEVPAAMASPVGDLGIDVVGWVETDVTDRAGLTARLRTGDAFSLGRARLSGACSMPITSGCIDMPCVW